MVVRVVLELVTLMLIYEIRAQPRCRIKFRNVPA
jgi:hypothetical protein